MKNADRRPPARLSTEARRFFREVSASYAIDDEAGRAILGQACESLDRLRQAQAEIKRDGPTTLDRFRQRKVHPAVLIERDSRSAFLGALKQLNLDLEPLRDRVGRPGGR